MTQTIRTLVLAALLLVPVGAQACSCVFPKGSQSDHVRREFKQSSAVFSAYVHDIRYEDVGGHRTRMARLRVLQSWKGEFAPDTWLEVIADADFGMMGCGYAAEPDTAIVVYADGLPGKQISLASCSLTGPLHRATDDIPLLNRLSKRQRRADP